LDDRLSGGERGKFVSYRKVLIPRGAVVRAYRPGRAISLNIQREQITSS
jgi:hypothetical protein